MEEVAALTDPAVITKFTAAADIVNRALEKVVAACVESASIYDICVLGDQYIVEELKKCYNKKNISKNIAMPTCISVNNVVCHFSPLKTEAPILLKNNDVVKIEMGAHIDGFPAMVAHTIIVGNEVAAGRKANVIAAAHNALEVAIRTIKPGNSNVQVTHAVNDVVKEFKCNVVEGMLSHKIERNNLTSNKSILLCSNPSQIKAHEEAKFEEHEIYNVDVLVTTGDGKVKTASDFKTNIFRKSNQNYMLKIKASRALYSQVSKEFGTMAFSLRSFDDEKIARLGLTECLKTNVLLPYEVLVDKENEIVAQFATTILLMPSGTIKLTHGPSLANIKPDVSLSEKYQKIVEAPLRPKKSK
ncbi:Erbb3 binding protein 1 [Rozella allomycis CSF55]|uniref:Erbb3 binding protein 1 n=1 Tax=Rozella allomycis (strain CSF55) TaxID=988480 RepID=A0A4V1IZJ0_ROZAC|nr:Erbb3 binding protein 1 [Rozella allomycis CSF55]